LGFTEAGRVLLRGAVFAALASAIVPVFGAFCVLACVLLTALAVGLAVRPRVRIDGSLPERIVAGRPVRLTYRLTNTSRLPSYNLSLRFANLPKTFELVSDQAEEEQLVSRLAPGQTAQVAVTIRANRRGCYEIARPTCRSSFPLNLFWFGAARRGREPLIVLPAFYRLQMPARRLARHAQTAGLRLAGRVGASPEYRGTRPFVAGDSPRHIDARAWARLAAPATKEYDEDCDSSAGVVLDTRLPAAPRHSPASRGRRRDDDAGAKDGSPLLEAAVSLCASAAFTMNPGSFIDLVLAGPQLHEFYGWPRGARLDRIHELLAGIEPSEDDPAEDVILSLADRFHEMSQVVFIVLNWGKPQQKLVELAEQAGCLCTVVRIGHPAPDPLTQHSDSDVADSGPRVVSPQEILSGQVKQL
jgi:uncharacterized protein (DUF58 family)